LATTSESGNLISRRDEALRIGHTDASLTVRLCDTLMTAKEQRRRVISVEPMTGIEPAYSAWGSAGFTAAFVDVRHRQSR
jgi:hypothetical protein